MNIFTYNNVVTGRVLAVLTAVSMILSALPVHFFMAEAAPAILVGPTDVTVGMGTAYNQSGIDASGYENLMLSFDYDASTLDESPVDSFQFGWSDGSTDHDLGNIFGLSGNDPSEVGSVLAGPLPVGAQIADLHIYVRVTSNSSAPSDQVEVTNLILAGDLLSTCTPQYDVVGPTDIQNTDTSEYFNSIQDAIDDCDTVDGNTVKLFADVSTSEQVTITKGIRLNGNNHTLSPSFTKTTNSNNAAIGINADNVRVKKLTIDGSGGTDLHGVNVYLANNVHLNKLTFIDVNRSAVVVNGSEVTVKDITTSGSGWNAIDVDQGSGVTSPSILTVTGTSAHAETSPFPQQHIKVDDNTKDVTVHDVNAQYDKATLGVIDAYTLKTGTVADDIVICHANNGPNYYTNPTVSVSSIINLPNGHAYHNHGGLDDLGDIIPPFDYDNGNGIEHYDGKNWTTDYDGTTGEEIYADGQCVVPEPVVTVVAHKIVCEDESMLPNWGAGAADITATTATDFVAANPGCRFEEGWDFQWAPQNTPDNGDTFYGALAAPWTTFGMTDVDGMASFSLTEDEIDGITELKIREVLQDGYIPFTHDQNGNTNTDDVSAEIYCHNDVLNYDNDDRIRNFDLGETYNCVAWNVPEEPEFPWCSYAGTVTDYTADEDAVNNSGNPVNADRRNITAVETVAPYQNIGGKEGNDWQVSPLDFFTLGIEGYLVYEFTDAVAYDQAGPDIAVYEITGGSATQQTDEKIEVSVSQNGVDFISLGEFTGDAEIDIAPAGLDYVKFVRLDDTSAGIQGGNGDGYDVDAIVILNGSCGEEPVLCTLDIVSDTNDFVVETNDTAKTLSFIHNAWTAVIAGATWIWGDDPVVDSSVDETQTFQKGFGWSGTVTSAALEVASDNSHTALLNSSAAGADASENNFQLATQDSYDVTSLIQQGNNDLSIAVKNWGGNANPQNNPAGLMYKLHIEGHVTGEARDCSIPYVPEVLGCTDSGADNYNPEATVEDESCTYPPVDVCENIDDVQETLPEGYEFTGEGICTPIPAPVCATGDNLLLNGSFEEPSIGKPWIYTSIANWVVTRVSDATTIRGEIWKGLFGAASDGNQNVELDSTEPTVLTQNVVTIPGATYELRFDFSPRPGRNLADNNVDAQVDGVTLMNASADGTGLSSKNWSTYSETFVADDASTDISFADNGTPNSYGSLVDNAVLCYVSEPELEVGPYCGDEEVNQDWEQCELGDEGCTDYCTFENQCTDLRLIKITMDDTDSVSFDDMVYLGDASNPLPNGIWFNFDELGDDVINNIATQDNGLAVSRDIVNNKLVLGFRGENDSHEIDQALGRIETMGISLGSVDREPIVSWPLEDGNGNFLDVFEKNGTSINFDLRADTGRDAVTVEIDNGDEYGYCPEGGQDLYKIEGYVWHDNDEDELWDEDEGPLTGWNVHITNGDQTLSTTSDANGLYYFDVPAGTWTITEDEESGWVRITQESYVVTVPETVSQAESPSLFADVINYIVPTAYAATESPETVYGDYNFGNNESPIRRSSHHSGSSSPYCDLFKATVSDGQLTLNWDTRNGFDLTITQDGNDIYTETDNGIVENGSFVTDVNVATYELTVHRGSKDDTCSVEVGPEGQVLGASTDQVSIVPLGAADAGAGGTTPVQTGTQLPAVAFITRNIRKNV